jgi:hypothetical protein
VERGVVGVADHAGWAVLVTVGEGGRLVDRRRVELIDDGLPKLPHHHEAQGLPVREAVELIERVRASAQRRAVECLDALASEIAVVGIALRTCPTLPPTVAERIENYRAQNVADSVMYREALADAAKARDWTVHWYVEKTVFGEAAEALGIDSVDAMLHEVGRSIGPPWRKDHRVAMAAAIASGARRAKPGR